ncbi:hypothetical protein BC629DRAFT_1592604 [Irpex lacteus]|nr:hypothetical protein BC629DRAFT_1592604 [Irpex lacteus]
MKGGGVVVGTAEVMLTQRREDGVAKAREMLKTVGSLCFVILFDLKEGRGWEVPTVSAEQEDIRHLLRNWANANTQGKFEIEDPLTHKHPMYSGGQHTWWGGLDVCQAAVVGRNTPDSEIEWTSIVDSVRRLPLQKYLQDPWLRQIPTDATITYCGSPSLLAQLRSSIVATIHERINQWARQAGYTKRVPTLTAESASPLKRPRVS